MVKNLKRLRRQLERDSGKLEAQKYPLKQLTEHFLCHFLLTAKFYKRTRFYLPCMAGHFFDSEKNHSLVEN